MTPGNLKWAAVATQVLMLLFAASFGQVEVVMNSQMDARPQLGITERSARISEKTIDTLVLRFDKIILPLLRDGFDWETSLKIAPGCEKDKPIRLVLTQDPTLITPDSLTWRFYVENLDGVDLSQYCAYLTVTQGNNNIYYSSVYSQVVGASLNNQAVLQANSFFKDGRPISEDIESYRDNFQINRYRKLWIPPQGYRRGKIEGEVCNRSMEQQDKLEFPQSCLSAVKVISKGQYTANIRIYDNRGNFIHQSIQHFGQCGELKNRERFTDLGKLSWLIWNLRDAEEQPVGNGVYVWKVTYAFKDGAPPMTATYRQGVARNTADYSLCESNL